MTTVRRAPAGFTLIELLVVMGMLSAISIAMYQVMFSGARGGDVTEDVARVSEEARLGLNRMIRDTREGQEVLDASSSTYTIQGDYDRDGTPEPTPTLGGHPAEAERLTFSYDAGAGTISLNGELLLEGVGQVGTSPVFGFFSSNLRYDANSDGITDVAEINSSVGNNDGLLDLAEERALVDSVVYTFTVRSGDSVSEFHGEAQMRNRRQ